MLSGWVVVVGLLHLMVTLSDTCILAGCFSISTVLNGFDKDEQDVDEDSATEQDTSRRLQLVRAV